MRDRFVLFGKREWDSLDHLMIDVDEYMRKMSGQ
jgi:hypothetical protein